MCHAQFKIFAVAAAGFVLAACSIGARADGSSGDGGAYQSSAPIVRLQVTGTGESISLDAERADVQSALKAVLKQAGKQFAPDATVAGQVTLLLNNQPLDTVLHAICEATYLKFSANPSGLYKFTRDDAAVRVAFTHLGELNAQLKQQLRYLGLDVPQDIVGAGSRTPNTPTAGADSQARRINGPATDASKTYAPEERQSRSETMRAKSSAQESLGAGATKSTDGQLRIDKEFRKNDIHAYLVPQGSLNQLSAQLSRGFLPGQDFSAIIRQNGLVWFNIPEEKPEPVAGVLQLFSQQSNTPILLDQSIPSSLKFRVWGSLSPRQLPEALNLLAPTAHLQWRWIGNTIFVVPAPTFTIFWGDPANQRSSYPAPARGESNAEERAKRGGSD